MSPRISSKLIKNDEANLSKIREVKTKIKDFQRFIKKILTMLEKIFHMKQDRYIMEIKNIKKVYMARPRLKRYTNLIMKV